MNSEPKITPQEVIDAIERLINQLPDEFIGSLYDFEENPEHEQIDK